nr:hypothetical protein [uncultured Cohaesibacter sp.]
MTDVNAPWSDYQQIVVETYAATKSGKSSSLHVRPVKGEAYPTTMDVECSRSMRKSFPVLYSHFNWPCEAVEGCPFWWQRFFFFNLTLLLAALLC